jgi:1-acyl-sn-glycerol-3-phosphate acyltransferase
MVRIWARFISRCMGLEATVQGEPPSGSFLLVANHVSYVDIFLLSSFVDVVFIAKSEMRHWPFIGPLASSVDTIYIDRSSRRDAVRVSSRIDAALDAGAAVALFPEGTSTDGADVLPFRSALLEGAAQREMPVHFATIRYAAPEIPWFGDTPLLTHAWKALQIGRVEASLRFGGAVTAASRKDLAERLREYVRAGLTREVSTAARENCRD